MGPRWSSPETPLAGRLVRHGEVREFVVDVRREFRLRNCQKPNTRRNCRDRRVCGGLSGA